MLAPPRPKRARRDGSEPNDAPPPPPPPPPHALIPPGGPLDDVVGQDVAKAVLVEASLLPLVLPRELLTGVRRPPAAVLLYGPPGALYARRGPCAVMRGRMRGSLSE